MLLQPPSNDQLRKTFERVLKGILSGEYLSAPDGTGLDEATNNALNDLVGEQNNVATKTLAARQEFMAQLSGEHDSASERELLDMLGEFGAS